MSEGLKVEKKEPLPSGTKKNLDPEFLNLKKRGPEKSLPSGWRYEVKPGTPAWVALDQLIESVTHEPGLLQKSLSRRWKIEVLPLLPPLLPGLLDVKKLFRAKHLEDLRVEKLPFWENLDKEKQNFLREYLALSALAGYEQLATNIAYIGTWQKEPLCGLTQLTRYLVQSRRLGISQFELEIVGQLGKILGNSVYIYRKDIGPSQSFGKENQK